MSNQADHEDELIHTSKIRRMVIDELTGKGTKVPTDLKETAILLMALNDASKQAIAVKKISSDEKTNSSFLVAQQAIAELYNGRNLKTERASLDLTGTIKELEDGRGITDVTIIEGELDETPRTTDYEQFLKEVNRTS